MAHEWKDVPTPFALAARPKDARGFPITFVTLIQSDGRPDFTTVDGRKIVECIRGNLCAMCGRAMERGQELAFIGGPKSIEHQNFLDPPMHVHCAEYAMQVCPHIAISTSRYGKPKVGEGRELFKHVDPNRPEKFGLYVTDGYRVVSLDGQPVFLAHTAHEIRWQEAA